MCRRHQLSAILIAFFLAASHNAFAQASNDRTPPEQEQQAQAAQTKPDAQEEEGTKPPPPQEPEQVVKPAETAKTPSTVRRIATNFWFDQKGMWTSPFRMNSRDGKWWALFAGSTAALIPMDKRLSNGLPNTVSQIKFSKNVSQIGAAYTTLPIAGGLYLYGRWAHDSKAREVGVLGAETLLDAAIMMKIMKLGFGRERPELDSGRGRFFRGEDGFPSGHAMETWAFASLISHEYAPSKIVPIVTYALATTVSVSRFTGRKHYASDIVAGGAMGWFMGRYVFEHHLDPNIHKRYGGVSKLMSAIHPVVEPSTRSYGIGLAWQP